MSEQENKPQPASVSAIIPCYNDGKYLWECLLSIHSQSHPVHEVIVVDDGSDDKCTLDVIRKAEREGLAVAIRQANQKPAKARNTGFQASVGDYILIIDSDDLIDASLVEKSVKALAQYPEIGVVSSWAFCFGNMNYSWMPTGGGLENFRADINCPSCAVVRREAWESTAGFDVSMVDGYEDWEFWVQITKNRWHIHIIDEYLYFYRMRIGSRVSEAMIRRKQIIEYMTLKHNIEFGIR